MTNVVVGPQAFVSMTRKNTMLSLLQPTPKLYFSRSTKHNQMSFVSSHESCSFQGFPLVCVVRSMMCRLVMHQWRIEVYINTCCLGEEKERVCGKSKEKEKSRSDCLFGTFVRGNHVAIFESEARVTYISYNVLLNQLRICSCCN